MIKTGLLFGSFNPVHIGHLIIAQYIQQFTDLEDVWLVVSPRNPLKPAEDLLDENERLKMAQLAVEGNPLLKVCDVEFALPRPSYTIDTLKKLELDNPDRQFVIIAGTDIFSDFVKWKDWQQLLEDYSFYIYNRPEYDPGEFGRHNTVKIFEAPLLKISSTFIRNALKSGKDVSYMIPEKVWKYLAEMGFYKK